MSTPPAPLNRLRKEWREGRPTFGAIATIPSIQTVRIMAQSLDWIIVFDKNNPPPTEEQTKYVDEGLTNLDKALALNPDYEDAMTYKNLLYREKARLTDGEDDKKKLTAMADEWFNKALETRKKNAEKKKAVGGN